MDGLFRGQAHQFPMTRFIVGAPHPAQPLDPGAHNRILAPPQAAINRALSFRDGDSLPACEDGGLGVSGVGMADDARIRIIGEDPLEALIGELRAVGADLLVLSILAK
jgi:hypothetical protein